MIVLEKLERLVALLSSIDMLRGQCHREKDIEAYDTVIPYILSHLIDEVQRL